ncbi:MAG: hypothetical protein ACYTHJ_16530 [Planctomycetota bacterium]
MKLVRKVAGMIRQHIIGIGSASLALLVVSASVDARCVMHVFAEPSDDVWHYPFNFTPGFRPVGGVFSSGGIDQWNDRDGMVLVAWETDDLIPLGQNPDSYQILDVRVTITNQAASFLVPEWIPDLTVDEWFTYLPGGNDTDPGRPIELFGVGFGPQYSELGWTEGVNYVGATQFSNTARDPFPMTFQDETGDFLHVEDNVRGTQNEDLEEPLCDDPDGICPFTPIPWAMGEPMGYVPGQQTTPFDIAFVVDLEMKDGAVRQYFQEQLSTGRVLVSISSLVITTQQAAPFSYPSFFLKEGVPLDPLAKAPTLTITLAADPDGDVNQDGIADEFDWAEMSACMNGPATSPQSTPSITALECQCSFDFDNDHDVDLGDFAVFAMIFGD